MKKLLCVAFTAVLLAACGGGGGGGDSEGGTGNQTGSASAEGFWTGQTSTGYSASIAILENGDTWGVYTSGNLVIGALHGQTQWSNDGKLSGSGSEFNLVTQTVSSSTFSGTFESAKEIAITTADRVRFDGSYEDVYEESPSLAALAGTFSGSAATGSTSAQTVSVNVTAGGVVTVPDTGGCSASGTVAPRPTGKNVFDVSVTFAGSSCALGSGTRVRGVAFYDVTARQLLVLALNAGQTDGFIYLATK